MSDTDERLRQVELWQAGVTVEIGHIKDGLKGTVDAIASHVEIDTKMRLAQKTENRRFLLGILTLMVTVLVAAYFK